MPAPEGEEKITTLPFILYEDLRKISKFVGKSNNSDIRITLDTPQDYSLLCTVYDELYEENNYFLLSDILELFVNKPWLKHVNEEVIQKKVCNTLQEELQEAISLCERQDLDRAKEFLKSNLE